MKITAKTNWSDLIGVRRSRSTSSAFLPIKREKKDADGFARGTNSTATTANLGSIGIQSTATKSYETAAGGGQAGGREGRKASSGRRAGKEGSAKTESERDGMNSANRFRLYLRGLARQFEFEGRVWREIANAMRAEAVASTAAVPRCAVFRRRETKPRWKRQQRETRQNISAVRHNALLITEQEREKESAHEHDFDGREKDEKARRRRSQRLGRWVGTYPAGPRWEPFHLRPESQKQIRDWN